MLPTRNLLCGIEMGQQQMLRCNLTHLEVALTV